MYLWTIQHHKAYENMLVSGYLRADEKHLFCEDDFRFAYDWMAEQMRLKIGPAPNGVEHPVWAWYQWSGKHKRPDMRSLRKWSDPGTPIVLMTVEVPDDEVLLSDFDLWHIVMSNNYCPKDESDIDYMDIATDKETVESWQRIFIADHSMDPCPAKYVQATVWQIKKDWVKKAEFFVSG